jgi:16S rRNA (cytosine967-C5)-methyltransferase
VLVDAPCTGTGTWRRRPDAKWRLAPGALELRQKEQAAVLEQGARLVRPGGRLVYVTCSVLPEENEDRIAAFLATDRRFQAVSAAADFAAVTGRTAPAEVVVALDGGGDAVRLTPATVGTDGFFIAVLERA